jgi:hypothetical protein
MWDPEPDELYTVGPESTEFGLPCAVCGQPFAVGDVITWRPWPPNTDVDGYGVSALYLACLRATQPAAERPRA